MARLGTVEAKRIYPIAQRFVESALRHDDSLFTPGRPIWTQSVVDDLYERFNQHPDASTSTTAAFM